MYEIHCFTSASSEPETVGNFEYLAIARGVQKHLSEINEGNTYQIVELDSAPDIKTMQYCSTGYVPMPSASVNLLTLRCGYLICMINITSTDGTTIKKFWNGINLSDEVEPIERISQTELLTSMLVNNINPLSVCESTGFDPKTSKVVYTIYESSGPCDE